MDYVATDSRAKTLSGGTFNACAGHPSKLMIPADIARTAVPNGSKSRPRMSEILRLPSIPKRQQKTSRSETAPSASRHRSQLRYHRRWRPSLARLSPTHPTTPATPRAISISGNCAMESCYDQIWIAKVFLERRSSDADGCVGCFMFIIITLGWVTN